MSFGQLGDLRTTKEELEKPSGLINGKNWLRHEGQAQRIDEMLLVGATKQDIAQNLIKTGLCKKDLNTAIKRVQRHIDHIRKEEHKIPLKMDAFNVWRFDIHSIYKDNSETNGSKSPLDETLSSEHTMQCTAPACSAK